MTEKKSQARWQFEPSAGGKSMNISQVDPSVKMKVKCSQNCSFNCLQILTEKKSYPDFLRVACHVLGRSGVETTREEVWGVLPRGGGVLTLDHEGGFLSVLFL